MSGPLQSVVGVAVVVTACLLAGAGPAMAQPQGTVATVSFDIGYPQCGTALPLPAGGTVVGVNGGVTFKPNPCLAGELRWARRGSGVPAFYANTADPGPLSSSHWPTGQRRPRGCDGSNSVGCSYDYGWNAAKDSFATAVEAERLAGSLAPHTAAAAARWWLDVEITNTWETLETAYGPTAISVRNDQTALLGARDALSSLGVAVVGFYSTPSQWAAITGGTGTAFASSPVWIANHAGPAAAQAGCNEASFSGGPVTMTQYIAGSYDADYSCRPVPARPVQGPSKPAGRAVGVRR